MAAGNADWLLPYKTYEICNRENMFCYWGTYAFQVFASVVGTVVNVVLDTLLASFVLLTCAQIDLCCRRFAEATNDDIAPATRSCVAHQLLIRRIVRRLESFFMCVVMPMMFLSLTTFCTSVYNLSQTQSSNVELAMFATYIVSLLFQLACYCWFGNELKLKSSAVSDAVYNSDWTTLKPSDRRSLYFVMLSCQKELSISYQGFCAVNMEVFVWVLKSSYGAYNLLTTIE